MFIYSLGFYLFLGKKKWEIRSPFGRKNTFNTLFCSHVLVSVGQPYICLSLVSSAQRTSFQKTCSAVHCPSVRPSGLVSSFLISHLQLRPCSLIIEERALTCAAAGSCCCSPDDSLQSSVHIWVCVFRLDWLGVPDLLAMVSNIHHFFPDIRMADFRFFWDLLLIS